MIVVLAGDCNAVPGLEMLTASALDGDAGGLPALVRRIAPWDTQSIIYTSGTTGPSKGAMSSYAHLHAMSGPDAFNMLAADDRYMGVFHPV